MVNTAHSHIMAATLIDGIPITMPVLPASTYTPADWVYLTAAATATHLDIDTAICKLVKPFLLEFRPRVDTANTRKDCDNTYATTDIVPMIMGARGIGGPITTVSYISDPGATKYPGHTFIGSGDAGRIKIQVLEATGATDGLAFRNVTVYGWNPEALASGDTYIKFTWW